MAVTVTIAADGMQISQTGNTGFDAATRIARVLRQVIEAFEGATPTRGLSLGDLVILELGGRLRSSPIECEPGLAPPAPVLAAVPDDLPAQPAAVCQVPDYEMEGLQRRTRERITRIAGLLAVHGSMPLQDIIDAIGEPRQRIVKALQAGPFVKVRFGIYANRPASDQSAEPAA